MSFHVQGSNATWFNCFGCYIHAPGEEKKELCSVEEPHPVCKGSTILLADSNYAAQLSWWFSFFSPDRFLILRSTDVQTTDLQSRATLLNRIKAFAGVSGDNFPSPESDMATSIREGHPITNKGHYNLEELIVEDAKALLALRLLYRQPLADLNAILRKHYRPDFPHLDEEISEEELRLYIKRAEMRHNGYIDT